MTLSAAVALPLLSLAFISVRRTQLDGWVKSEVQKECTQLAPGVNYCQELGKPKVDQIVDVAYKTPALTNGCLKSQTVKKDSMLLLHHTGLWAPSPGAEFQPFFQQEDFTVANATKVGVDTLKWWDMAVVGLCEGEKVEITLPPELGYEEKGARLPRPDAVPAGATLRFEVEVIKVLHVGPDGIPFRPCFFSLIDTDGSGDLDEIELARHFQRVKQPMPPHVMSSEDKDGDGRISFDEFTGPKIPPETREQMLIKDEL